GMNTHTFGTPFSWDGTSNIVINICHTGPGGVASTVSVSTFGTARTTAAIATGQCSITTGLTNLNRPVITLGCENPITWTPITELYTDALATVPYVTNTHFTTVYAKPSVPRVYTAASTAPGTGCNVTATGTFSSAISVWDGVSWTPGTPTGNTSLQFTGDYTSSANLSGCSCTVTSGHVVFNDPATLTLTNGLTVGAGPAATLTFNNNAGLVQIDDTATNSGVITMERITQPVYRFDYTYWGSPVTLASNFTLGNLSPGTQPDKYYSWIPTFSNNFGTWAQESAATVMDPIKGYIVRAPNSYSNDPGIKAPYVGNFIGTPNNGVINTPIYHGTQPAPDYNDDYNLLGNPYPSALDAEKFLSNATNVPILDGTIYFWTHNSPISTSNPDPFYGDFIYNYTANDYASWNKLGGSGTTSAAASGGATPTGFIAAGQAFFAKSRSIAASGSMAVFNNSMRAAGNNNQFFRMANDPSVANNNNSASFEKHRIWLNLISASGTFNQVLIGYAEGATLDWDRDFDGVRFTEVNATTFYSVIPDRDLVIQGRPLPFTDQDQVALGYKSVSQDTFSFRIDHFDALFQSQDIYIEDKLLNIIHDLKVSPYVFTSAIGTFNDRFVLRFNDPLLHTKPFDNNPSLIAFINDHQLYVESSQNIQSIAIYDVSGKWIKTFTTQQKRTFREQFNFPNGMYLAKIKLESELILTRKLAN
ncbi:MAG TPA: T9SS type A sorting domain-containing protein, partial [Flavobacterium sp.]|nr:T9SS type A sorting domain-containing protein [Flavobacterium sp.]